MMKEIILSLARRRCSIRKYSREAIDLNDILYAISAAIQAPSGANRQPWRFIIIANESIKKKLREACELCEKKFYESDDVPEWFRRWVKEREITWAKPFLTDAPYLIVVSSYRGAPYFKESTWLAIGYLLLALEERGIASLTYTPSNPDEVAKVLKIPEDYSLEVIIPVGKPADKKAKEPRFSLQQVVFYDQWGKDNMKKL